VVVVRFDNLRAKIEGDYPLDQVRRATSFFKKGFQFTTAYRRKGKWDGRTSLLSRPANTFPAGLVPAVVAAIESQGESVELVDERELPVVHGSGDYSLPGITLRDYQVRMIEAVLGGDGGFYRLPVTQAKRLDTRVKLPDRKNAIVDGRLSGRGIWWSATGSGKTEAAIALTKALGARTLFVVRGNTLVDQTRRRFADRLGVDVDDIGRIAEGSWAVRNITIAGVDTLATAFGKPKAKKVLTKYLNHVGLLFADECHNAASDNFSRIVNACPAYYRIAMSGTPLDRSDGANLKLVASFCEVVERVPLRELVEKGIAPKARIRFIKVDEPKLPDGTKYQTAYKLCVADNELLTKRIAKEAIDATGRGKSVLVLVDYIKHGQAISDSIWKGARPADFVPNEFVHGEDSLEEREAALGKFRRGELPVLVASCIFGTGLDVPNFDVIINAAGGKSPINALQRIGRGLRGSELTYIEFAHDTQKHLRKHSMQRLNLYKKEGCFDIEVVD